MQRACARASELVGATLADIRRDKHGDRWLHVLGKRRQARQGGIAAACANGTRSVSRAARLAGHARTLEPGDAA